MTVKIDGTFKERKQKEYMLNLIPYYPNAIPQKDLEDIMGVSKQLTGAFVRSLEGQGKVKVFQKGKQNYVTREGFVQ